jgi:PKD repeat protein
MKWTRCLNVGRERNSCRLTGLFLLLSLALLSALACRPGLAVSVQPGWPQITGGHVHSSPALGDLDGDGDLEVVVGSNDSNVYAWHHEGSPVTGWPKITSGQVTSSPALGDLDGDGDLEVVVGSNDSNVYAWHHDGSPVAGWPQTMGDRVQNSPALGDLDGDGELEVVVVVGSEDNVYAWHNDGSPVAGWPQTTGSGINGSPALGDLDGDGELEVVVGSEDNVYAWHHDGTALTGWPRFIAFMAWVVACPGLGDLEGDGELEVVVGALDYGVYAWHHDGTAVIGWPQSTGANINSSPALGDLDGDGDLEVVVGSDTLHAWHHDGTPVTGWPQMGRGGSSPALGDLDGDGDLEVVVGSSDYNVRAWHGDGTPVTGWPQSTGASINSSPALGDLDGDGDLEVVVGSLEDYKVYAWSCDTLTDDTLPWPMFHHDALRAGLYAPAVLAPGAHFIASPLAGTPPLQVTFTDRSTDNPTSWSWDFGDGATSTQQNPTHEYTEVGRYTVSLAVTTDLGPDTETKQRCITALFPDVLTDHWAWRQVIACVDANIVKGYDDGLYHPEYPVTRDQMAVYISRALVSPSGDAAIPDPVPPPSFSDVSPTHWAYKHIEYAVSQNVVKGYDDGTYQPGLTVDRGQMAVYVARAMVAPGGDAAIPDPVPPATFPDVPDTFWAYKQVEYCVGQGVVKGYDDGTYRPANPVTRDQMAVYVARAFGLL